MPTPDPSRARAGAGTGLRGRRLLRIAPVVWAALALVLSFPAHALAETWGLGEVQNRGVDGASALTFRDLLRGEMVSQLGVQVADVPGACADANCVRAGAGPGVAVAVHVSIGRLGSKLVVSVNAVDAATGASRFSERMSAAGAEELDVVAARMVEAMGDGGSVEETAELGNITKQEAAKPRRRRSRFAGTLGLSSILPLSGYADEVIGGGVEAGLWFETYDIAIEPRIGIRFDMADEDRDYFHVPIEVGASWLITRSDFSPTIGGGVGLHFAYESVQRRTEIGELLVQKVNNGYEDFAALFAVYGRVGLLLMRTYDVSLHVSGDIVYGYGSFEERGSDDETAIRINLHLIMGS